MQMLYTCQQYHWNTPPPNVGEAQTSLNTFYQHLFNEDPKVAGRGIRTLIKVHDNIKIDSYFFTDVIFHVHGDLPQA